VTTALYAGSFDPIHLGHLSIIERAAGGFDEVVVAVIGNPAKRSGLLTVDERLQLVDESTAHLANVRTFTHHGLSVDAARLVGATVLLRSAHKDRGDEHTMAATNERIAGVLTVFLPADLTRSWISSSLVRSALAGGRLDDLRTMVPTCVWRQMNASDAHS
jgi:pantetheine-phosphate adenylyltransferase